MSNSRPRGILLAVLAATLLRVASAVPAQAPFRDGFEPGPGVLLEGADAMPAMEALIAYGPHAARGTDIEDGVLLTRIEAAIAPDVTVMEVNAALAAEQASIVAMRPGLPILTLRVPRQPDLPALKALVRRLQASSAFVLAQVARESELSSLPPVDPGDTTHRERLAHLLASRFPAAWNVSKLATEDCQSRRVPIVVPDSYHPDVPARVGLVLLETGSPVIDYSSAPNAYDGLDATVLAARHGYDMLGVLASRFDAFNGTGAMPFPQCLDITPLSILGLTHTDQWLALDGKLQSGEKMIVSRSVSFPNNYCPNDDAVACIPAHFDQARQGLEDLATNALLAATVIVPHRDDVLLMNSAGNQANKQESSIYHGFALSQFASGPNLLSALASGDDVSVDTSLRALMTNAALWDPTPGHAQFPSLRLDQDALDRLSEVRRAFNVAPRVSRQPIVRVGAGITTDDLTKMQASAYSSFGPDVSAPADPIYLIDQMDAMGGTSSATPQVAGLAAYMWLISPQLRQLPTLVTRRAIIDNTAESSIFPIDAYASVLSTDKDLPPTPNNAPVRLALLDLDEDGDFDEDDVERFMVRFLSPDAENAPSYGREDLNGDGFIAGREGARFDLDRAGSVRFGRTDYSTATQLIEGRRVSFSESGLTDLQILCYYAYSPMYTGDAAARTSSLADACATLVGPAAKIDFAAYQALISGDTAFVLETNYPTREGSENFRLHRMNLRTSQLSAPEKIHPEGTVPDGLLMTNALMPTPDGRSPLLATWYVHGAWEPVEGGSMAPRKHVWARYFDPRTQAWDPAIELGNFLDSHTSLPAIDMAVDAQGNAMVLWVPPITPESSLRRATYRYRTAAGGAWSAATTVDGEPNYSTEYEIAAGNGVITMAWSPYVSDGDSLDFRLRARRFDIATASWGEQTVLASEHGAKFRLRMDAHGGAIVVWNEGGGEWVSNYSAQDDTWSVPFSLGPVAQQSNLSTRLSLDAAGNAVLHSRDPARYEFTYSQFDAATNAWPFARRKVGYFASAPLLGRYGGFTVDRSPSAQDTAVLALNPFLRGEGYRPAITLASYAGREAEVQAVSAMGADGRGLVVWQALVREPGDGFLRQVVDRRALVIAPTPAPEP